MTLLVPIAMFGWPVVVLLLFSQVRPRTAVLVSMLGAWLLLPIASYKLPGVPDVNKVSITCAGSLLGALIFDSGRFAGVRFCAADAWLAVWLLVPIPSAVLAGYPFHEGVSGAFYQVVAWGLPYLLGRLYFADLDGLRALALAIFVAGLLYAPLVLFEAKMSPQLHSWVYGFHPMDFVQSKRGSGYRPSVFMQHGLAVAMFMGTAAVCGVWLSARGVTRQVFGLPAVLLAVGLIVTTLICRSTYAAMLMMAGIAVLYASGWARARVFVLVLLAIPPLYMLSRTVGGWDAGLLKEIARALGGERAESLEIRLSSEDTLWRWVSNGAVWFGRCRLEIAQLTGEDRMIPDGMWIIALGTRGVVGLAAVYGVLLAPPLSFLSRAGARIFRGPEGAGAAAMCVVLALYALDNLLNAMINPIMLLAAGGLAVCAVPRLPAAGLRPRRAAGGIGAW